MSTHATSRIRGSTVFKYVARGKISRQNLTSTLSLSVAVTAPVTEVFLDDTDRRAGPAADDHHVLMSVTHQSGI